MKERVQLTLDIWYVEGWWDRSYEGQLNEKATWKRTAKFDSRAMVCSEEKEVFWVGSSVCHFDEPGPPGSRLCREGRDVAVKRPTSFGIRKAHLLLSHVTLYTYMPLLIQQSHFPVLTCKSGVILGICWLQLLYMGKDINMQLSNWVSHNPTMNKEKRERAFLVQICLA